MKPSYEELKGFITRLHEYGCEDKDCKECVLFFSGFCNETQELAKRLEEDSEEE